MMENLKKKRSLFNWPSKKDRASSKEKEKTNDDLKVSRENKTEKLYNVVKDCEKEIKSLKARILQMRDCMTDCERHYRLAEIELQNLKKEIGRNLKDRTFSTGEKRNIDARITNLENQLVMGPAKLKSAKIINDIHIKADLSHLERNIKEIKRRT